MKDYNQPTSDWEFSHCIEAGDELVTQDGDTLVVDYVNEGGTVYCENGERFTEEEITGALADGNLETPDGLSHELATF